jgi:hypothetical protein
MSTRKGSVSEWADVLIEKRCKVCGVWDTGACTRLGAVLGDSVCGL